MADQTDNTVRHNDSLTANPGSLRRRAAFGGIVVVVSASAFLAASKIISLQPNARLNDLPAAQFIQNDSPPSGRIPETPARSTGQAADPESPANDPSSLGNSSGANSNQDTTVTVNGQDVPVPQNGTSQTEIPNNSGNTSVIINQHSSGNSSNGSSSTNIQIESRSTSTNDSSQPQPLDPRATRRR